MLKLLFSSNFSMSNFVVKLEAITRKSKNFMALIPYMTNAETTTKLKLRRIKEHSDLSEKHLQGKITGKKSKIHYENSKIIKGGLKKKTLKLFLSHFFFLGQIFVYTSKLIT